MKKGLLIPLLALIAAVQAKADWSISEDGTLTITSNYYFSKNSSYPWHSQRSDIKNVVIADGVTEIGYVAFQECANLETVSIANSVTTIYDYAFYKCSGLKTINIPDGVKVIDEATFQGCSSLESIELPNGITKIASYAFYGCTKLTNVNIPTSVITIGDAAFYETNISCVVIPEGATTIGEGAFMNCSNLVSVTIPKSLTKIAQQAFAYCNSNLVVHAEAATTPASFALRSFDYDANVTIYIPYGTKAAYQEAWIYDYNYIEPIYSLSDGVLTLWGDCNYEKATDYPWDSKRDSIRTVVIEDGVTTIGYRALELCTNLTNVSISNSVTTIATGAFGNCVHLSNISIPQSVTTIGYGSFYGCYNLKNISVSEDNKTFDSRDNCNAIIKTKTNELIVGGINTTIPNSVTSIGSMAFYIDRSFVVHAENAPTPATLAKDAFYRGQSIFIPQGTKDAYTASWGEQHTYYEPTDAVIALIHKIDTVVYTEQYKTIIENARDAFEALPEEQKSLVTNADELKAAISTYKILEDGVITVTQKIDSIGVVEYTEECRNRIINALRYFESLTNEQKYYTGNKDILLDAVATYNELVAFYEKVNSAINKISTIGAVEYTKTCKALIDEAKAVFDALTDEQKALVTNAETLTAAIAKYEELKALAEANQAAADAVIAKIEAIGTVVYTETCKALIDDAKAAFDALTDEQKARVTNAETLTEAIATYESLQPATGIKEIFYKRNSNDNAWYDLLGHKFDTKPTVPGLYIHQGERVLVK